MKTVMSVNTTENKTTEKPLPSSRNNAVHSISKWLNKGDELDRCSACHSLGVLGDHDSITILAEHLQDEDIDVCIDAAEALGLIGDRDAVTLLLKSLDHETDGDITTAIVKTLGKLGGEQAVSRLLALATSPPEDNEWDDEESWDSNWDIQISAVQALAQLRTSAAVIPLSNLLTDNECPVDKSNLFNALAHIGGTGERVLIKKLHEDISRERRRAACALGINCTAVGARALGRALQDPEPEVRAAAADALSRGNHERYVNALLMLLHDSSSDVRKAALNAVSTLTNVVVDASDVSVVKNVAKNIELEKLLPLLDDSSPEIITTVLNMLHSRLAYYLLDKNIKNHLKNRVQPLLKSPHTTVATAACLFSPMLNSPETREILLSLARNLQGDSALRKQAIIAIGQCGNISETVLMALTELLNTEDYVVLFATLQTLLALHMKKDISNENEIDGELPTPLEIIISALQGDVVIPLTNEKKEVKDAETEIDDTSKLESSDTANPVSTLDSIALGNAEMAHKMSANKPLNSDETLELSTKEMETFQPYYDILKQQKINRKKFTREKTTNIAIEVRRLSARILGEYSQPDVVKALLQTLYDAEPDVQHEAISALARINPDTPGIAETLGPLTSFLHLGNMDLRIISTKALGALGNMESLPVLLGSLHDESRLVRNQAILSVSQIVKKHVIHSSNITKPLAIANKREQAKAIDVVHALRSLADCLNDADVGVRKTTALVIAELGTLLSIDKLPEELRTKIVEHLITAGFTGEGQQARDMAKTLRIFDSCEAGNRLVYLLDNVPSSVERRIAMEMLEEIFQFPQAS